ncbi:MAG: 5' nucleotidase, NT5C type [Chitinophagaceae bacterium]
MKRVIIDMDEVIADPMGDMVEWYETKFEQKVDYDQMREGSWVRGFPEQHRKLVLDRLYSEGFFRNLPVMDDAQEVLKEMNKRYEIFIVSAAVEFPNSLKDKHDWLLEHFPFFTWKQLVLCGDKRMIHGDYMIDDHVRNLVHFPGKKYLYAAFHNREIVGYDRIHDWKQAATIFLK